MLRSALLLAVVALAMVGCATTSSATTASTDELLDKLPTPQTSAEARAYFAGSLAAMRADQPGRAVQFLEAILRSDHLTERGRADVYWLIVEAHRLDRNEVALADALGGFLVAAEVVPPDEDIRQREVEARATLLAKKVKTRALFGKSPDAAIPIEDVREAPSIVAELGCGKDGAASWVEDKVSTVPADDRRLEERSLICSDGNESLELWFDVTQAR
jgi:hypothetical protein